jgi:histidinol-phosphate aminotransferase
MDEPNPVPKQYICDLAPYQPGLPIALVARQYGLNPRSIIKLASNENPLGMGPNARAALLKELPRACRYPEQYALLQAISHALNVPADQIVLGNGSNDVLDLVARTFLAKGDEAVSSQYAFAVYAIATQSTGARSVVVTAKGYAHDLAAMVAAVTPHSKVLWIANPNNPTGTFIPYNELYEHLSRVPRHVTIVLDEAYYEYLENDDRYDSTRWLQYFPNLILVRTFSKIHGLAGLRIGYALTSARTAELMNRVRQPFNVSTLSIAAAVAALGDMRFVHRSQTVNRSGRTQLLAGLKKLAIEPLPAYGNFVTFAVPCAAAVNEALLRTGIIVRLLASYGMPDHLRVTIGTAKENQHFLAGLHHILMNN